MVTVDSVWCTFIVPMLVPINTLYKIPQIGGAVRAHRCAGLDGPKEQMDEAMAPGLGRTSLPQ